MALGLHPRLRLDISASDLAVAAVACVRNVPAAHSAHQLEQEWAPDGDGMVCLSVRSAFDLYLTALDLPAGSEVLFSAITIPDMPRIAREHGLVPVPVDLDERTLAPSVDAAERAWSPRARVIVLAHLFGGKFDLAPLVEWARARDVRVVEDLAQGFTAPDDRGSPLADVTFFSFGTIKTLTALGGALVRVSDPPLLVRMRALHDEWPVQPTGRFAKKVARTALLLGIAIPFPYALLARFCRARDIDFDRLILSSIRGFPLPPGGNLLSALRFRPCGALVDTLRHRLNTFDPGRLANRAAQGDWLAESLRDVASVLGDAQPLRTHWLFAITTRDRAPILAHGRRLGLDITAGASNIAAVPRPAERPELPPLDAERMMQGIVFIPAYPEVPESRLGLLVAAMRRQGEGRSGSDHPHEDQERWFRRGDMNKVAAASRKSRVEVRRHHAPSARGRGATHVSGARGLALGLLRVVEATAQLACADR